MAGGAVADPILKTYASQVVRHFELAGMHLSGRQNLSPGGAGMGAAAPRPFAPGQLERAPGNVPPWPGSIDVDFHGTLAAIWIWARHQVLSGERRFGRARELAWAFIDAAWFDFIPEALGPAASDEAAFDCAMVLRAATAELALAPGANSLSAARAASAARVLGTYLSGLEDLSGREFQDPGFLAWSLIEYGRAVGNRGVLAAGRGFVERAFGMKAPPSFRSEAESPGGLFDFSSTTATRVLATLASEGNTPFVGAWLRERVLPAVHPGFLGRNLDENCWNACVAAFLGRAYAISTDPRFLEAYRIICAELARRDFDVDGAIACDGRDETRSADTLGTFYYALATDALLRQEGGGLGGGGGGGGGGGRSVEATAGRGEPLSIGAQQGHGRR
jgi:hypothetical protein